MKALELITTQATAPSAGAAFTAVAGNSLTIRDTSRPVWLVAQWDSRQVAGFSRVTSPLLHDAVVGIQQQLPIGQTVGLVTPVQRLYPQDTLVVFGSGSAVAGDIEQHCMLFAYEDLPGIDAYLINRSELMNRAEDIYSFTNTIATSASGYSGSEQINAEQDQLKANTDYAIVGYTSTTAVGAIRWVSSDWGNLGLGGPGPVLGTSGAIETREWFLLLSDRAQMPLIPVFNSSNKSLTFIDATTDENLADPTVTTLCVRLAPKGRGKRQ